MQLISIIFMEAENSDGKSSRKLDFSAPLMSTRRPTTPRLVLPGSNRDENRIPLTLDVSNRIPFSWEQEAGKPKETEDCAGGDGGVPLLKPPPGKWYPRNRAVEARRSDDCDCCEKGRQCGNYDGDVEGEGNRAPLFCENRGAPLFSDALDLFSLGESSSTASENGNNNVSTTGTASEFEPDLIFLRFLKDAKALAADSLANCSDSGEMQGSDHRAESCFAGALSAGRRYDGESPCSKACGLDAFLPWRMKPPKPCGGARSSVVAAVSPRLLKPHWGAKKSMDHV